MFLGHGVGAGCRRWSQLSDSQRLEATAPTFPGNGIEQKEYRVKFGYVFDPWNNPLKTLSTHWQKCTICLLILNYAFGQPSKPNRNPSPKHAKNSCCLWHKNCYEILGRGPAEFPYTIAVSRVPVADSISSITGIGSCDSCNHIEMRQAACRFPSGENANIRISERPHGY
jgi:hypothetical protein